jgi:hypothetical protein
MQSQNVSAVLYFIVTVLKYQNWDILDSPGLQSGPLCLCCTELPLNAACWCFDFLTNPCLATVTTYKTLWHATLSNWAWFVTETSLSAHSFAIRLTEIKDTFNSIPIDHVYLVQSVCHLSPYLYTYFSD